MFGKLILVSIWLISSIFAYPLEEFPFDEDNEVLNNGLVLKKEDLEKYYGFNLKDINDDALEDAFLTTPELLDKYNYFSETHHVQTSDGYILEMHRIPKPGQPPVFLMHGILDSSAGWVIAGSHSALAYYLSDLGYDVWMGNARGNVYSRRHIKHSSKSKTFWDFSFQEIAIYDVPAMLDYVIERTGQKKIDYIGHSQGTTVIFAMCSELPEYCKKLRSFHALAPVAYLQDANSLFLRSLSKLTDKKELLTNLLGLKEFPASNKLVKWTIQKLCHEDAAALPLCYNNLFLIVGFDSEQLNKTTLPTILTHVPAGASTKQFVHYGQFVGNRHFRKFDYGLAKNLFHYGQITPPSYDLSMTTPPTYIYYSKNDNICGVNDVKRISNELPNVRDNHEVQYPKFNHLDFLFAMNSRKVLYNEILKNLA